MNHAQLAIQFKMYLDRMNDIMKAKNADYAGAQLDALGNFKGVEQLGVCLTETGFLTRMLDKYCRVATFVAKGVLTVRSESVEDTLIDLANYSLLLACHIKDKREQALAEFNAPPPRRRKR